MARTIKRIKRTKKWHRWPGLLLALFLILFSVSGIVMNHRNFFAPYGVSRSFLPSNYSINNWNNASVKGVVEFSDSIAIIYGNVGAYITYDAFNSVHDFNKGFPKGVDYRNISQLVYSDSKTLYAGTKFGIYCFDGETEEWTRIALPSEELRIEGLLTRKDSLYVMTRSEIFVSEESELKFSQVQLKAPIDFKNDISLFRTFWFIHSGELFGFEGKLFVDLLGIIMIIISFSGIAYFFVLKLIKRRSKSIKSITAHKSVFLISLKWHKYVGLWSVVFLLILTLTGLFLRPPLLIPIANVQVPKIKYTHLYNSNPWFLRFRGLYNSADKKSLIVITTNGIYSVDAKFKKAPVKFTNQPPYSVMGVNVFKPLNGDNYLIGSFSGLFVWNPKYPNCFDYIEKRPHVNTNKLGSPVSSNLVSGFVTIGNKEFVFDYFNGCIGLNGFEFSSTPDILKQLKMSLWNVALEVHTGRIFESLLGKFYILYIPITGIFTLVILINGFIIWKRKRNKLKKGIESL